MKLLWEIAAVFVVAFVGALIRSYRAERAAITQEVADGRRCPKCRELYVGLEEDCRCTGVIYR
jgi:hypothetical protein